MTDRTVLTIIVVCAIVIGGGAVLASGGTDADPRSESVEDAVTEQTPTATPTADEHGGGDHGDGGDEHGDSGDGHGDGGDGMMMDMQMVPNGTIVNENTEELPPGCEEIAGEKHVTVESGREFAQPGEMFTFETGQVQAAPCTKLTVTFINHDSVRHQWMVHGLPMETYPMGMFNIEVNGPASVTATFVTPSEAVSLHTHCSLPQHEQKGMAMSVVIGEGGDGHGHGDGGGHNH